MAPQNNDSLSKSPAIRGCRALNFSLNLRRMETQADRRLRKLRWLCLTFKDKGGLQFVADEAQLNANTLDQVLKGALLPPKADGTRSPRKLGDRAVEQMEASPALGLGRGWFDTDDGYDDFEVIPPAPGLAAALPVVLDALAKAPARAELRHLLPLLIDTDSPLYRQRLAELLAEAPAEKPLGAPIATEHQQTLQQLSDQAEAQHAASKQRRRPAGG